MQKNANRTKRMPTFIVLSHDGWAKLIASHSRDADLVSITIEIIYIADATIEQYKLYQKDTAVI